MSIVYDPVNLNAASGTELMMRALEQRLDGSLSNHFSIGRAIMLFKDHPTTRIYWTHNLPGQMNIREVSEYHALRTENRWKFNDRIVFVSEWQKQQYINHYKFSAEDIARTKVLRNAIVPIPHHHKPDDKIRLIYMSVPERGLQILYDVFEKIAPKYDIELEVFSSYKIYGIPNTDIVHRQLLDKVKSHPQIRYHGTATNEAVREALQRAHIFAYPSTFLETSCLAMIEAMSANCMCVHSDIAAMSETAAGFTTMYPYTSNRAEHADVFQRQLELAIYRHRSGYTVDPQQKTYIDQHYSWDTRIVEWEQYLQGLTSEKIFAVN